MRRQLLALSACALPLLAACSSASPSGSASTITAASTTATSAADSAPGGTPGAAATPKRYLFSIANGKIDGPTSISMKVGETIELRIATDRAAQIHAHVFEVEKDFVPGETGSLILKATAPGAFDVEDHVSNKLVTRILVS